MSTKAKTQTPNKPRAASRVLDVVYETAADLERLGFINKRKMQKLDALCMAPIAPYDSAQIRALREQHKLSQTVMASVLNTSASTVRKWEIGEKHPSGPSLKLLNLLDRKGLDALL
jgi:putative transcriptional regulator